MLGVVDSVLIYTSAKVAAAWLHKGNFEVAVTPSTCFAKKTSTLVVVFGVADSIPELVTNL